jgi:regulatory protein
VTAPTAHRTAKPVRPEPTALERALRLLGGRSLTARQLEQALARKGVPGDEREAALARVAQLGYIDDAEVARERAQRFVGKGDAPRLAARRLRAQGVAPETAEAAAQEAAEPSTELELAAQALRRKLRGRPIRDEKERGRLFRSLLQKGHRAAVVAKALEVEHPEGWDGDDGRADDA